MKKQVGQYAFIKLIGKGGMGDVYLAKDTVLDRDVAIKVIKDDLTDNKISMNRFMQEAKTLAKLNHSEIAGIYNVIEDNGRANMVMEYVDGLTLEDLLKQKGEMKAKNACKIISSALKGLDHAHKMNIVHRDIKPSNIMINTHGQVKLMDFGIALSDQTQRHTKTGNIIGTIEYISPDIIQGDSPSVSSDIYAMGIVLYELLFGKTPFSGTNEYSILQAHIKKAPEYKINENADIPRALVSVLKKALAKKKAHRFQSANEMCSALEKINFSDTKTTAPILPLKLPKVELGKTANALLPILKSKAREIAFVLSIIVLASAYFMKRPTESDDFSENGPIIEIPGEVKKDNGDTYEPPIQKQNLIIRKSTAEDEKYNLLIKEGKILANQKKYLNPERNLWVVCKEILEIEPFDQQAKGWIKEIINYYLGIGSSYLQSGNYLKAIQAFNKVLKVDPNNAMALKGIQEANKLKNQKQDPEQKQQVEVKKKAEEKEVVSTPIKPIKKESKSKKETTEEIKPKETVKKVEAKNEVSAFIPKDLTILVSLSKELNTTQNRAKSETVDMYVRENVYHEGKLIFKKGDKVKASLDNFKSSNNNNKGLLELNITSAQAMDGSWISLKRGKYREPGGKGETIRYGTSVKFEVVTSSSRNINYFK